MPHLPGGVEFEAVVRLLEEFPSHRQVVSGRVEVDMTQVSRQMWQEPLYILPLAVLGDQSPHGEGMTEIVEPRLKAPTVETHNTRLGSQPCEHVVGLKENHWHMFSRTKERKIGSRVAGSPLPLVISPQRSR